MNSRFLDDLQRQTRQAEMDLDTSRLVAADCLAQCMRACTTVCTSQVTSSTVPNKAWFAQSIMVC
jgi:hypothetical protein